ncbi:MAG: C2H2-type zinc finger protein [Nitrososphaeraceae archaeon]|nr:C2H2-type zinc finger protein [Nitrososphaeraceae archaeon]MDW0163775.1 C2H2-type zinc finger protein [Nitrososphaeraceae archaeon]MDW0167970.1 C2H2-type zinc finger protein [Nitrososphaeraceae archaeon]MDW0170886.1 C2H2-type zinc finger protein [Nitrososphaeraceae archaeon]MDW0172413.1 C2H2-type zinc finger protein [Nitrososphaeraceae archaeon]
MSSENQEKCAVCGMTFNNQDELKEHMLELHRE